MKYMHFNSSCSYAGLANLLEIQGYDTEDYKIALDMGLPYFLNYDEETGYYQAGAMLQSKEWFDLYLKPRGYCYVEKSAAKEVAIENLYPGMMIGIQVTSQSKHAVICAGVEEGCYSFLNNKWEASQEEEKLHLTKKELQERLPEEVTTGWILKCEPEKVDLSAHFGQSLLTWKQLKKELQEFVEKEQSPQELHNAMNRIFRPFLVDSLAMMKLMEQQELVANLEKVQRDFLNAVRKGQTVKLTDEFDCTKIDESIDMIVKLIEEKCDSLSCQEENS